MKAFPLMTGHSVVGVCTCEFDQSPSQITREFRHSLMRIHEANFYADRGDLRLQCCFRASSIDVPRHFEKSCDQIAQPHWLTLLVISSENRGNRHTRRMPANLIAAPDIQEDFP